MHWTAHDTSLVVWALIGIAVVVVLITQFKVHPFIALILGPERSASARVSPPLTSSSSSKAASAARSAGSASWSRSAPCWASCSPTPATRTDTARADTTTTRTDAGVTTTATGPAADRRPSFGVTLATILQAPAGTDHRLRLAVPVARQRCRLLAGQGVLRDERRGDVQDLVGDGDDHLGGLDRADPRSRRARLTITAPATVRPRAESAAHRAVADVRGEPVVQG
jgi:hypothetical protein